MRNGPSGRGVAALMAATAICLVLDGAAWAQQAAPAAADIKQHETTAPGQYEPSLDVLKGQKLPAPGAQEGVPSLTQAEADEANTIYFQRCAGCHGVLRKGATGKALTTDLTRELGADYLKNFITYGSPGGMPNWGTSGDLSEAQIDIMTRYLLNEPVAPPEWGMNEMQASWEVLVPVDQRPTKQMNKLDLDNLFSVTLRNSGEVALIDGKTYEIVKIFKTGYAVHISRMSASGRYLYVIGRDGLLKLIDLYMDPPEIVASLKIGVEARSVETSKMEGWEDKYAIAGAYWPPQYVIMDGATLEPLKIVSTRGMIYDEQNYHPRAARRLDRGLALPAGVRGQRQGDRVHRPGRLHRPRKPQGDLDRGRAVPARRRLRRTGRYFLVAANARNKVAVVDTKEGKLSALIRPAARRPPGSRRQLRASEVRPGLGDLASRQRACDDHRHRPEGHPDQCLEGRADAGPARAAARCSSRRTRTASISMSTRRSIPRPRSRRRSRCSRSTSSARRRTTRSNTRCCRSASGRDRGRPAPGRPGRVQQGRRRDLVLGLERQGPGERHRRGRRQDPAARST